MDFENNLKRLLEKAVKRDYAEIEKLNSAEIKLLKVEKGTRLVEAGNPIKAILVLIWGKCDILKISQDGQSFVPYTNERFQIFGLTEMLVKKKEFSASITAAENCLVAKIEATKFYQLLLTDIELSRTVLPYLANLVEEAMQIRIRHRFTDGYERLLLYLYEQAQGRTLPYRVEETRKALAEVLEISLRTLYRYTDRLIEEGYAARKLGKLIIDVSSLQKLEQKAQDIYGRL